MNNKMDLLVSFDTTGSMYPVLSQVRQEVEEFVHQMFKDFTDLRLGIIAHGDYCDKDDPYTIRIMDFTKDENRICDFVKTTDKTYGGDVDECYELVLNVAHQELKWRDDADKLMIMIGDASPHGVNYPQNTDKLDWVEEAEALRADGIKVFAVHALSYYRSSSKAFYKRVADETMGVYLTLDQFNEIVDLIKATVYQQGGEEKLSEFVSIIRDNGKMTRSMENNFKRLRGEAVEDDYMPRAYSTPSRRKSSTKSDEPVSIKDMGEVVPVMPGRFQIMTVDENCDIKGFVTKNGIEFKKGRGFYELSKAETVQQYKEVIMMDRETGEMFNGSQVREELGLSPQSLKGGVKEKLHKADVDKFRVFVQSTSVNRKLIAGTTFLYEISDMEDTGTVVEETTASVTKEAPKKKSAKKPEVKKVAAKKETETKEFKKAAPKKTATKKTTVKADDEKVVIKDTCKKADKKTKVAKVETKVIEKTACKKVTKKPYTKPEIVEVDKSDIKLSDKDFKDVPEITTASAIKRAEKAEESAKLKAIADKKAADAKVKQSLDASYDKITNGTAKVQDGLNRIQSSLRNKKHKTFLKNNVNKLIDELNKVLKELDNIE